VLFCLKAPFPRPPFPQLAALRGGSCPRGGLFRSAKGRVDSPIPSGVLGAGAGAWCWCWWVVAQIIKRRIEHLIEREYLERDTSDANLYRYLA
jgi:hypothetical protein